MPHFIISGVVCALTGLLIGLALGTPRETFDDDAFAYCVAIPPPTTETWRWGDIIEACTEYAKEAHK